MSQFITAVATVKRPPEIGFSFIPLPGVYDQQQPTETNSITLRARDAVNMYSYLILLYSLYIITVVVVVVFEIFTAIIIYYYLLCTPFVCPVSLHHTPLREHIIRDGAAVRGEMCFVHKYTTSLQRERSTTNHNNSIDTDSERRFQACRIFVDCFQFKSFECLFNTK